MSAVIFSHLKPTKSGEIQRGIVKSKEYKDRSKQLLLVIFQVLQMRLQNLLIKTTF